jgi:excisionase family DNA binding protein
MSRRLPSRRLDATDLAAILAQLEVVVAGVAVAEIPEALGELERLKAELWARWLRPSATRTEDAAQDGQLLGIRAAAELLGISRTALRRLEMAGGLAGVRIGRRLLFRADALAEFAGQHERRRSSS